MCYNGTVQKELTQFTKDGYPFWVSDISREDMLGDKGTTVRIRDNLHYRIWILNPQVGMLIVLCTAQIPWEK